MSLKLVVAFEVLSLAIGCSSQLRIIGSFCHEDDCYIKLENNGNSSMIAQQNCRMYNSTLPIVDNPDRRRSLSVVLNYFKLNNADVWLGATATDYGSGNWSWLDGKRYSGTVVPNSVPYNKSYAFLSKNGTEILAYASAPYATYSYICQYDTTATDVCNNGTGRLAFLTDSKCYVKYSNKSSWFNARNNCLTNNGDLASFIDFSLLDGIVDSSGSWIALRRSQWKWQVAVTGESFDVTFTSWRNDQPNDPTPTCIGIDYGDFPNWRDRDCSDVTQYICQLLNATTSTASTKPTSAWTESTSALSVGRSGPMDTISASPGNGSKSEMNVRLAIGLGVGLGAAFVIAIVVIIIILVVRRNRQNNDTNGKSMSRGEIDQTSSEREATEINGTGNVNQFTVVDPATLYAPVQKNKSQHTTRGGQFQSNEASTNYATVKEVQGLDRNFQENPLPAIQGAVYAGLGFGQSSS